MAVDEVISSTKEKLESLLAPIGGGVGADISYDETFERVKVEVEKLTSMSGGKVDWASIVSGADEILADKGKDFRVAMYYAAARTSLDGVPGLCEGFVVLKELISSFWEPMGPPLKRPKARGNLCGWFSDLCAPLIATYQPSAKERDIVKALDQVSRDVDLTLAEKLGDAYSGMAALRSNITNLVRALPAEAPPPPPPPPERPVVEVASTQETSSSPAPTTHVESVVVSGGLSPESIVDSYSASNAIEPCSRILVRIAATLRAEDPTNAFPYRLLRSAIWMELNRPPPADGAATMVPPPSPAYRDQLESLLSSGSLVGVINLGEDVASEAPLWLDPHRYVATAMERLGGYEEARAALLRELAAMLLRAPTLPQLTFNDGTPLADPDTAGWLEAEVKSVLGSGGGGVRANPLDSAISKAQSVLAEGNLMDALALVGRAATVAPTLPQKFRAKLASAKLCLSAEQFLVARAQLDGLDRLAEQHRLAEWEPDLAVEFYSALYSAHRGVNLATGGEVTPEARARELQIFDRLCLLDAGAALKLMTG